MNTHEQTTRTAEREAPVSEAASGPDLEATRGAHQRLQAIARGALEKISAMDAEHELEVRRQRGGQ